MIYDITQPLFECDIYPGDPKPERTILSSMEKGDAYNLSSFSMCAHNGTHVDAPYHFLKNGKNIDEIDVSKFVGKDIVVLQDGYVTKEDAYCILEKANGIKKILIKGNAIITLNAAKVFAEANIDLIGNESQSIGPMDDPDDVHITLLKKEVVLLEGIRLDHVPEGIYVLNCAPLNLNGLEGAPCRAVLMEEV